MAGTAEQVLSTLPERLTLMGLLPGATRGVPRRVGKLPMQNRQHDANNGAQECFSGWFNRHPTFDGKGVFMTAWHFARRWFSLPGAGLLSLALSLPANAAIETQVVFFPVLGDNDNVVGSLLIDFVKPSKARVVSSASSGLATVARRAAQFVLTLDSPISQPFFTGEYDSCGGQPSLRKETHQFVVRGSAGNARSGVSKVVEIGTLTTLDGCDAGRIVPFGALTDAGVTMNWVAMNARPSIKDLLPGTQLAGLSEQALLAGQYLPMDVVTLFAGNLAAFATTGNVVPAAFNADQWLVFGFAGFERAYTRLAVDKSTGAERWLRAEWSGGEPQKVETDVVVKPDHSAGFGTVRQASRKWESGLFSQTMAPFFVYLYGNGTGERGTTDLATGTESRLPITWAFSGKNILQARLSPPNRRDRIWVPLRNHGAKIRFVMESESISLDGGLPQPLIPPRVNFYIDNGRALNPTGLP